MSAWSAPTATTERRPEISQPEELDELSSRPTGANCGPSSVVARKSDRYARACPLSIDWAPGSVRRGADEIGRCIGEFLQPRTRFAGPGVDAEIIEASGGQLRQHRRVDRAGEFAVFLRPPDARRQRLFELA